MGNEKSLDRKKKVVMYGAGQKSHNVYHALLQCGYTVEYCVVTSDSVPESDFETIKVYPLRDRVREIIENDYQVVIASFQRYEAEIEANLEKNGVNNYWKASELPWSVDFQAYAVLDEKGCIEKICGAYTNDKKLSQDDHAVESFVQTKCPAEHTNEHKILFLVMISYPRQYKIIEALHRKGYEIEVLFWVNALGANEEKINQLRKISNRFHLCISVEEIMLYSASSEAKIMHIFADVNATIEVPQIIINFKNMFPSIVYDEYDIATEMYRQLKGDIWEKELFCLEHADGICHRGTEIKYLEKKYSICEKQIHLVDCCKDHSYTISKQKAETDELQLVYAGGLYAGAAYDDTKLMQVLEYADICKRNHTHFHVYPSSWDKAKLHTYFEKEKENEYFHMHPPVPFEDLCDEISQYDYGVMPAQKGFLEYAKEHGNLTWEQQMSSATNKKYDYLDAGLPIVAASQVEESMMLEADGVLIRWTDEEIEFDELRARRNEMKRRVVEVREKYRISKQLPRLIEFYNSL